MPSQKESVSDHKSETTEKADNHIVPSPVTAKKMALRGSAGTISRQKKCVHAVKHESKGIQHVCQPHPNFAELK